MEMKLPYFYLISNEMFSLLRFFQIREALRDLFRSCNRRSLHEIVIVIGASCAIPQEIYQIPIRLCDSFESDLSHCGQNCAELSARLAPLTLRCNRIS